MAETIGVVLLNLGGPDSLEAVEPFLYNLFQDPDIFTFPLAGLIRKPLAKFIAKRRAPKSRVYFEYMGGKSPITELTMKQAVALESALNSGSEKKFKVLIAMRYWNPNTEEVLKKLQSEGIEKVILLPLYPQYSYTTTRSSMREWYKQSRLLKVRFRSQILVEDYHDHPLYIQALAERIGEAVKKFPMEEQKDVHLLFSAHGIPVREIEQGDPYEKQIRKSVDLVMNELGYRYSHHLSYQSKVGPLKWLEPTTVETVEKLAAQGVKNVIAIPISFVSDHSETLYELKKMYGELAIKCGMKQYELMPALNDSPLFIDCLKEKVLGAE